jgi:hypothetical protein
VRTKELYGEMIFGQKSQLELGFSFVYNNIVAEQMHECINVKNPPNCVGGICVFVCVSFLASLLLALLLNTSAQFTLLRIIAWSSTVVTPLVNIEHAAY